MYSAPPFFTFHYGNLFEQRLPDGRRVLHMDMAGYRDPTIIKDLSLDMLMSAQRQVSESRYQRVSIPLDDGSTELPVRAGAGGGGPGGRGGGGRGRQVSILYGAGRTSRW